MKRVFSGSCKPFEYSLHRGASPAGEHPAISSNRRMTMKASITEGQEKQYRRFVEDAARKGTDFALREVFLNEGGIQKLIENGDKFSAAIVAAIVAKTRELSVSSLFADEEVVPTNGYPPGYHKPKDIAEQMEILWQLFPGIGFALEQLAERPFPPNTEGYFAIPKWETMAKTYGEAVQKVLDKIEETRNGRFYNSRDSKLGPQYLRQSAKSAAMFQALALEQRDHNILVVAAHFGINHGGRSVRRAQEVMLKSEFGLGAFAVGIMLLTHPERLGKHDDLWIDCAGDEYRYASEDSFVRAPYFDFSGGTVEFGAGEINHVDSGCGSASASVL